MADTYRESPFCVPGTVKCAADTNAQVRLQSSFFRRKTEAQRVRDWTRPLASKAGQDSTPQAGSERVLFALWLGTLYCTRRLAHSPWCAVGPQ